MLSHLRFHRRAPSNPASPLAEQAPALDAAAQREHPLLPRDVSPRPDARPSAPDASSPPPTLPPIPRVTSTGSDQLFAPHDGAPPASQDAYQPPARPPHDTESRGGFIGGVALEKYRRAAQEGPNAPTTMAGQLPETQLSRAKPPPPPINTGLAARPAMPGTKQSKSSWFSAPTDLHIGGGSSKRPAGPRLGSEPTPAPAHEPHKGRKGLPFLKNPVSSLLRRKTANVAADTHPPAPSYDPRIKGTRVHDFSAPRPKKTVSATDSASTRKEGASPVAGPVDQGEPRANLQALATEPPADISNGAPHSGDGGQPTPARSLSRSTLLPEQSGSATPPADAKSLHTSSSAASRDTQVAPLPPAPSASVRTTASRQLSVTSGRESVASAVPRHMKSTSSRFSFDMIGAAKQEKLLEERHRQREQEKKADDPADADARFDDFDEDFDYDAMMDDDGLEERIPGVNADYEDEEDLEAAMDPDNDQENFAGFVFQRSNPASSLVSPHTPGMLPTPRDASGKAIGFAMTKDTTPTSDAFMSPDPLMISKDFDNLELGNGLEDDAPQEGVYRPSFPSAAANAPVAPQPLPRPDDDIYFDDGLADELDFEHDGTVFDESIFDNNDTDQYGRPIPGAFAQAKEAMQAAQQQQPSKRDSDMTSSASGQSGVGPSTAHTSVTVGQPLPTHQLDDESKPPTEPMPAIPSQDLAYQAALAEAAQKALASGKFRRSSSPEVLTDTPSNDPTDTYDPDANGYLDDYDNDAFPNDFEDDFDFDDEAIIAEANASALANDCDGFYGQEFGFYSAPVPHHVPHQSSSSSNSSAGGVLTTENLFQYANGGYFGPASAANLLNRSASGRAAVREPNLTPITERSEYSNRNSVMSFTLPPAIGSSGASDGRNSAMSMNMNMSMAASPGLAQLAMMGDDESMNMSLAGLMKLRSKAWGGSQGSLVSGTPGTGTGNTGGGGWNSREGSPRSEWAVPVPVPVQVGLEGIGGGVGVGGGGMGSPFGTVPAHLAGHVRMGSGLSLWSFSEEVGEEPSNSVGGGRGSGATSPAPAGGFGGVSMATVLPPRPGSAGAVVNGGNNGAGINGVPLPMRPQSLFLPSQAPSLMAVPSPGSGQMGGGSACSPVLEGEEHEGEGDGFKLAPALPVTAGGDAEVPDMNRLRIGQEHEGTM